MTAVSAEAAGAVTRPVLAMRGSASAAACEGDACMIPGAIDDAAGDVAPGADLARVRAAIDSGLAI